MPRQQFSSGQSEWMISAVLGGLVLMPGLAFVLAGGDDRIVAFVPDDAFYYLQTAHHFASSYLISFDGSNPTNGFHPLYFFLVTLLVSITGKPLLLSTVLISTALLLIASVVLVVTHAGIRSERLGHVISVLALSNPLLLFIWKNLGMESALVVFSTSLVFVALCRSESAAGQLRSSSFLGLALSLLMLSRLDLVVPAIVIVLLRFHSASRSAPGLRSLLVSQSYVCIPLAVGALYLTWNLTLTGHLIPISGQVKQLGEGSFGWWLKAFSGGALWKEVLFFIPMVMPIIQLLLTSFFRTRLGEPAFRAALFLCVTSLTYYIYLIFLSSGFFGWYLAFPIAVASVLSMLWLEVAMNAWGFTHWSRGAGRVLMTAVLAACMLFISAFFSFQSGRQTVANDLRDLAREVDERLGPDQVIGVFDAGTLGYFSTSKVINLDGLANNFGYFSEYLKPKRFLEYFREQGMTHLILRKAMLAEAEDEFGGVIFLPDPRITLDSTSRLFDYTIGSEFEVEVIEFNPRVAETSKDQ